MTALEDLWHGNIRRGGDREDWQELSNIHMSDEI